jgi:hypothetical protein
MQKSSSKTLVVACVATVAWLGASLALGWNAATSCDQGAGTFSCLKANEWGDFLAGVFAPVAFFWLVAAVWIQSAELREQRKELALTREEFIHQREVMQAQTDEAKKQAEFIGTQTSILRSEDEARRIARQDEYFDEHVSSIVAAIRQNRDGLTFYSSGKPPLEAKSNVTDCVSLEGFGANLLNLIEGYFDNFADSKDFIFHSKNPRAFLTLKSAFERAAEAGVGISSMAKVRFDRYGIDQALQALNKLEGAIDFPPEELI